MSNRPTEGVNFAHRVLLRSHAESALSFSLELTS